MVAVGVLFAFGLLAAGVYALAMYAKGFEH